MVVIIYFVVFHEVQSFLLGCCCSNNNNKGGGGGNGRPDIIIINNGNTTGTVTVVRRNGANRAALSTLEKEKLTKNLKIQQNKNTENRVLKRKIPTEQNEKYNQENTKSLPGLSSKLDQMDFS